MSTGTTGVDEVCMSVSWTDGEVRDRSSVRSHGRRGDSSRCLGLPLRRQRHLELDLRELIGRFAYLAQERQPARVGADVGEQVIRHDLADAGVPILDRFVEPLERLFGLATEGIDVGNVDGTI